MLKSPPDTRLETPESPACRVYNSSKPSLVMANRVKNPRFVPVSEMTRVEQAAITRAGPALAWEIFSDLRRWPGFTDLYGDLRWTKGTPWAVGSRMRMELLRPGEFIIDRVITMCRPGDCVAWIDHSRGSTVEQWLTFEVEPNGGTRVHIVSQGIGSGPKVAGQPFRDFLQNNVGLWLEAFCKECDRAHS